MLPDVRPVTRLASLMHVAICFRFSTSKITLEPSNNTSVYISPLITSLKHTMSLYARVPHNKLLQPRGMCGVWIHNQCSGLSAPTYELMKNSSGVCICQSCGLTSFSSSLISSSAIETKNSSNILDTTAFCSTLL